jgi:hypothetical protein
VGACAACERLLVEPKDFCLVLSEHRRVKVSCRVDIGRSKWVVKESLHATRFLPRRRFARRRETFEHPCVSTELDENIATLAMLGYLLSSKAS